MNIKGKANNFLRFYYSTLKGEQTITNTDLQNDFLLLNIDETKDIIIENVSAEIQAKRFLIISKSCDECGCQIAVKLFSETPTKQQIEENRKSIGGMSCIATKVIELNEDYYSDVKMYY